MIYEVYDNPVIQAVIRCRRCGQFLNLFGDDRSKLFGLQNDIFMFDFSHVYLQNQKRVSAFCELGIVSCKCAAISTAPEFHSWYLEDTDRFDSFIIKRKDPIEIKMQNIVGEFINKKNKSYRGRLIEASAYHIKTNCTLLYSFKSYSSELYVIRDEVIKMKMLPTFKLEETLSEKNFNVLQKLKKTLES